MRYDFYLRRQRLTLEKIIEIKKINNHSELFEYFKSIGIKPPAEQDVEHLFKREVANVEERAVVKSDSKKKGVSNKKANNATRSNSSSTRGSKSKQRIRKSPVKRQGKSKSNNDEPVQPASRSEDTK